ncbi:MAG: replication-relaxation family protein [bacterium]
MGDNKKKKQKSSSHFTDRDGEVILSVGKFGVLSTQQILKLHFSTKTGYYSFQRRLEKQLKNYLEGPIYFNVQKGGKKIPLYCLNNEGKKKYEDMIKREYEKPRLRTKHIPRILKRNDFLIKFCPQDFYLQYKLKNTVIPIYGIVKDKKKIGKVAIEIDLGIEPKKYVRDRKEQYERLFRNEGEPKIILFASYRKQQIKQWLEEMLEPTLELRLWTTDLENPDIVSIKKNILIYS